MSRLNSEALRRRWQNAAYREKQTEANRIASALAVGVPRVKRTKGKRMSEEVAQAAGDIAYWQRRAERAENELAAARALKTALDEIDREPVGAYEVTWSSMPEPCEACVEVREIAARALAAYRNAMKANAHAEP